MPGGKKSWAEIQAELRRRFNASEEVRKAERDAEFDRKYEEKRAAERKAAVAKPAKKATTPKAAKTQKVDPNRKTRTKFSLDNQWKKQLWAKSNWKDSPWNNKGSQRLHMRYRALTLDSKNPIFGRVEYAAGKRTSNGDQWAAIGKRKNGKTHQHVINGFKEWQRHLQIANYQLRVQAEHFRIVVGQRALRVFQLSFKYHKFYNEDTSWPELASYTQKKRKEAGTWFGAHKSKLYETGALSLSLTNLDAKGNLTSVITAPHVQSTRKYAHGSRKGQTYSTDFSYAGIHNEGVPKGRKPGAAVPKRQFMGWSNLRSKRRDKVDMFAYEVADRYLFDSVFMVKKR